MAEEDILGNSEGVTRTRFQGIFSCCGQHSQPTNKVLPHMVLSDHSEFVEIQPGRRLRVLNYKVGHRPVPPTPSIGTPAAITTRLDDTSSSAELSEEEYWFDNAAPNRLPVIQPQPVQVTQSRIINKFEPREVTGQGQPSKLEEDTISPGRLPRKNLGVRGVVDDLDDYEDEDIVSTAGSPDISGDRTETNGNITSNMSEPLANGLEITSGLILGITADTTKDPKKSSPVIKRNTNSPSDSPLPGREDIESPPPSSSPTPLHVTTPPPTSPDHLADDSCHPSPEIPHRSVSVVPDPDTGDLTDTSRPTLIIEGGNLGGVANQGFQDDDDMEDSDDFHVDTNSTVTVEATNSSVLGETVDAAYQRNRDLTNFLEQQEGLMVGRKNNAQPPDPPKSLEAHSDLPILFFLHGVGGSADIWRSQLEYFYSQGYQVVAPDMLGHGFSSCPDKAKAYTFTKLFKDILTLFDTYVPDNKRSIVFGHSYGCSFTVALARTRPDRISTLVMVASGGPTPLAPPPHVKKYPQCLLDCAKRVLECKWKAEQQHKYNPRGKTIKFTKAFDVPGYVFKHMMTGQVWPEGDAGFHRRVTCPTLLVYGMRDTLVSLVEECEMERTLPKAYLELIPTAGHCVMLDTPVQLNTMAHRFIKKWNNNTLGPTPGR